MVVISQILSRLTGLSARRAAAPLMINGTAAPGTNSDVFCGFDTQGWPPDQPPWTLAAKTSLLIVITLYAAYNPATDVRRALQAKVFSSPETSLQVQTAKPLLINGSAPPYNAGIDVQRLAQPKVFSIPEAFINPWLPRSLLINGTAPIPYNPATDVQRKRMAITFSTPETFPRPAPFNQLIVNGQGAPVPPPPILSTWNTPPMNFAVTVNGQSSVTLTWTPFGSSLVIGYYVFRDKVLITPTPIVGGTFTDTNVVAGVRYMYAVSAVDASLAFGPQTLALEADVLIPADLTFGVVFQEQPGDGGIPDVLWRWD